MIQCCKFEIIYFYQVEEMEDLIPNDIHNRDRNVDEILHNAQGDDYEREPVQEDNK